jgi:hypothetical protein
VKHYIYGCAIAWFAWATFSPVPHFRIRHIDDFLFGWACAATVITVMRLTEPR